MTKTRDRRQLDVQQARTVLAVLAARRHGVLSRREVVARGVPRWLLQAELRVGRWQRTGSETVVAHNGALTEPQRRAVAVLEVGPRAALDGVTAMQHLGVTVDDDGKVHVIAPKGCTPKHPRGVRVHESRRFDEADVVEIEHLRVVRPAVAAVHAAIWARTPREAQFLVILAVQQHLATAADIDEALQRVARTGRRRVIRGVLEDVAHGVRSVGELDVARALRDHGLPEPDRQVMRLRASGRQYLDCRFDRYGLTLEVDGEQHAELEQRLVDLQRDIASVTEGDAVVRIPLLLWRTDRTRILASLERLFVARGWRRAA